MINGRVSCNEPPRPEPHVPERFIQEIWRQLGFDRSGLQTTRGGSVQVRHPGQLNTDAGPDFRDAIVEIDGLVWRGDVEIHERSSGWNKHGHAGDSRYDSVILHVTLYADDTTGSLCRSDQTHLPEIVLAPHLRKQLWSFVSRNAAREPDRLPCQALWDRVPDERRDEWIAELARERFAEKREQLARAYLERPDLEHLLYRQLFRALGYSKNAEPMMDLADLVPLDVARTINAAEEREALYLGAAGLLPDVREISPSDPSAARYVHRAANVFRDLALTHGIRPMPTNRWTYFRLRPANFPTLRIAQAAALIRPDGLLARDPMGLLKNALVASTPLRAIRELLGARPSSFWETHVQLKKATAPRDPSIGKRRIDTLVVNCVAPVLHLDAEQRSDEVQREAIFRLLTHLPAESDRILRLFKRAGAEIGNGLSSQGYHQLYRARCRTSRCLECAIGKQVLAQ